MIFEKKSNFLFLCPKLDSLKKNYQLHASILITNKNYKIVNYLANLQFGILFYQQNNYSTHLLCHPPKTLNNKHVTDTSHLITSKTQNKL